MPSYRELPPDKFDALVDFLAQLREDPDRRHELAAAGTLEEAPGAGDVRPHRAASTTP